MKLGATISEKVEHVKGAANTGVHDCHWPGCAVTCAPAKWGCTKHWYMLPKGIRSRIWRAYDIGQEISKTLSNAYLSVAREAQRWIVENHGKQDKLL